MDKVWIVEQVFKGNDEGYSDSCETVAVCTSEYKAAQFIHDKLKTMLEDLQKAYELMRVAKKENRCKSCHHGDGCEGVTCYKNEYEHMTINVIPTVEHIMEDRTVTYTEHWDFECSFTYFEKEVE